MKDETQPGIDPNEVTLDDLEWTRQWAERQEKRARQPGASPLTICMARAARRTLATMEEDYRKAHSENWIFESPAVGHALERVAVASEPLYSVVYFYGDPNRLAKRMDQLANTYSEQHPGAKVISVTAEDFINGLIMSMKYGIQDSHPVSFRDCDFLIIKEFEKFGGKEACMEELYYILDLRLLYKKPFVICADRQPNAIPRLDDRLLTILEGGLIYQY